MFSQSTTIDKMTATVIPIGAHYLRIKSFNARDANSVVTNLYQIEPKTCHPKSLMDLFKAIFRRPLIDMLRNKEQLAYSISFDLHHDLEILSYSITVNSQETKFTTDYVDERIEFSHRELMSIIEQMSKDDYDAFENSLQYDVPFTQAQFLEFCRKHFDTANQRKISIQVIGNTQADEIDTNSDDITGSFDTLTYVNFTGEPKGHLIRDLTEFLNTLEVYRGSETQECHEELGSNSVNAESVIYMNVRAIYYCFLPYIYYNYGIFY